MPDFDMWSPKESGTRLAEQDTLQRFAIQAQAQHQQALAQEAQQRAQQSAKLQQAMSQLTTPDGQGGPGAGGSIADMIDAQAVQLSKLGFPSQAAALGTKSAQIRLHEARQERQEAATEKLGYEVKAKTLDRISQIYGQAKNEKDWAAANLMIAQQFPDFDNPLARVPYSPEAASGAAAQALSIKDKLGLKIKQQEANSQDSLRRSREEYLQTRADLMERQVEDRERRTDILEKTGGKTGAGKPVGSPSTGDVKAATNMVRSAFPNLDGKEAGNAAFQIAAEAKKLAKDNPGLSMAAAMQRAFASSQQDGDFQTADKYLGLGKTTKFNPVGKTPETAVAAEKGMKLQPGRYYKNAAGIVAKYNGKGFETVPASGGSPTAGAGDDVNDEGDE